MSVLGGQHVFAALQRYFREKAPAGQQVTEALSMVRATVLKETTPIDIRRRFAALHQQKGGRPGYVGPLQWNAWVDPKDFLFGSFLQVHRVPRRVLQNLIELTTCQTLAAFRTSIVVGSLPIRWWHRRCSPP